MSSESKQHVYIVAYNGGEEKVVFEEEDFMGTPSISKVLKCGLAVTFYKDGVTKIHELPSQPISGVKYYEGRDQEDVDKEDILKN